MRYFGILDGGDDTWGVRVPDFPGCHGGGASPEEAMRDAMAAMTFMADDYKDRGRPIPAARSAKDLLQDPEIRRDLAPGEVFVCLPLIHETSRPARANISLDAGLLQALDAAAKARGLTRSGFVASAVREKILGEV